MHISPDTAKHYLWLAMRKTGKETRTALALWYIYKYPTEEAREKGYVQACLLLVERMHNRSRGFRSKRK
jgi:hypothetical protein